MPIQFMLDVEIQRFEVEYTAYEHTHTHANKFIQLNDIDD